MKKRFLTTLLACASLSCFAIGGGLTARAENNVYDDENVMDIVEYFSSTEYMSEEGVSCVSTNTTIFQREWLGNLLKRSCGISFGIEFASNTWDESVSGDFVITLGASKITMDMDSAQTLSINAYNDLVSTTEALKTATVENFDATQAHEWTLARIYTTDASDTAYALKLYLDNVIILEVEDTDEVCNSNNHKILLQNFTGANVLLRSTLDEEIEFVEEQNVYDIVEFDGRSQLYSGEGLQIASSSVSVGDLWSKHPMNTLAVNMQYITDYAKRSNGMQWKMKAETPWKSNANLFRLDIGATDIRIGYDSTTKEVYTYTHTRWSEEIEHVATIAGKVVLAKNYEPTEWHKWRVARVAATNARGYAVRFYIDEEFCAELYTTGELIDKHLNTDGSYSYAQGSLGYNSVKMVNATGNTMAFRTAMYSRPIVEKEVSSDIFTYGATTKLISSEGLTLPHGRSAIDSNGGTTFTYYSDWYAVSGGVEFKFKASEDWGTGYDKLKILFGASDIRFNSKGNNKISVHIYNKAHDYSVNWGQEYLIEKTFDETQWHTIKITRRKFINTIGAYGEKGMQIAIYLDGEKILEKVEPISGMWSFMHRRMSITNLSGKDMTFKSLLDGTGYAFEDDKITELYDMPNNDQNTYYEDAFSGLEIKNANRIINSVYTEKFSSTTNGVQFILTSQEPWQTSGTQKKLVALTAAEMETLTTQEGKEVFKLNGTGDWTEVATTGVNTGTKYKFEYATWTSDWADLKQGNGYQYVGEKDPSNWVFPTLYKTSNQQLYYSSDTTGIKMTADWMATKYHIHMDFGTHTIQIKQTPDNKVVVRVYSKYSWILLFEDYVRDTSGNPIEFKTGTYTGNTAYNYHGQTLQNGDLYENTFKISKVRETHGNGFKTRIWINGYLGMEVYDPNPMGGEGSFAHFLIDNITGTDITAYSVATMDDFKNLQIATLERYLNNNYSTANLSKVNTILESARTKIKSLNAIKQINAYVEETMEALGKIWTVETEERFRSEKATSINQLNTISMNTYESSDNAKVQALLSEATEKINALTEADGFGMLTMLYTDYIEKMLAIPTTEQRQQIAQAQSTAKLQIGQFITEFSASDYTSDNFAKIAAIQTKYNALIDASMDLEEIESLTYLARSEMWAVETKAETALNETKLNAKTMLSAYKAQDNYLPLDWNIIQSIIQESGLQIDKAKDAAEVETIVTRAKAQMDAIAVLGDEDMIPSGEANGSSSGTVQNGCQASFGGLGLFAIGLATMLMFRKSKETEEKDDRK